MQTCKLYFKNQAKVLHMESLEQFSSLVVVKEVPIH